jgi:hypothetical protein
MTRKHYEMLADTLGRAVAVEACEGGGEGSRAAAAAYRVALGVADSLADTSPRYDGGRFLDAVDATAAEALRWLGGTGSRALEDALAMRRKGSRY